MNIKVVHLKDNIWRVIGVHDYDDMYGQTNDDVFFEGCLADCEAYINLRKGGYI